MASKRGLPSEFVRTSFWFKNVLPRFVEAHSVSKILSIKTRKRILTEKCSSPFCFSLFFSQNTLHKNEEEHFSAKMLFLVLWSSIFSTEYASSERASLFRERNALPHYSEANFFSAKIRSAGNVTLMLVESPSTTKIGSSGK